ncbi:MAG: Unknown protein [uncultured Sulfurovum sp.]|uniref:Uncharacterized protein n=1 Tax=uncultured Sulfurovum sp. TaxID=269237 RepID=A0A6S6RRR3_9BACT|nr:MAG: Unknown protein [uncultured Sulfurovum sp.]
MHGTYYYHRDHQGSIIALSNEHGEIIETITYDEHYGSILEHKKRNKNETLNPYGYTGREIEMNDLYYYRARYYDPTTQRFLSLDPIGFMSGDFNFYRYVGNSPIGWIDPFGLEAEESGIWDNVVGFITSIFDAVNPFTGINDAADMGIEYKGYNAKVESITCATDGSYKADKCEYKKQLLKKKCLENGTLTSTQLSLEQGMGAGKAGKVISVVYDNTFDKDKFYHTTETNTSIEQAIENANFDSSMTTSLDNNASNPNHLPITFEPIDKGTCYENITDTNTSDILKQDTLCDEEAKAYDYTINPD